MAPTAGQVEVAQRRVDLTEVRDRRDQARLQGLDGHDVLDADPHGVAGETLRVRDHDGIGVAVEDLAQCVDLRSGTAPAGRCVRLVGDEDHLGRHVAAVIAARLGLPDQVLHDAGDVVDVEPCPVERAVGGDRAQHLADGLDATLPGRLGRLDDDAGGPHTHDHAVPAVVEGECGILDRFVGGRGAGGQEARPDPLDEVVGGDVVAGYDDDPAAASGPDPVLGQGDALGGARAGGVELGVGPPRPDDLGELGVPHRQDPEEEPPVERVGLSLHVLANRADSLVDLAHDRIALAGPCPQGLQHVRQLAPCAVDVVALELVGEVVKAGEGRSEDDAGVVAQCVRQHPPVRKLAADAGGLVTAHQWDARVAHGVETGAEGEPGDTVEGDVAFGFDAELAHHVQRAHPAGELDDFSRVVDGHEAARAVLVLDDAGDVLVQHAAAEPLRDQVDALLAGQNPADVRVVEDVLHARQTEGGARDDDGLVGGRLAEVTVRCGAGIGGQPALDRVGEDVAELAVALAGGGGAGAARSGRRRGRSPGWGWRRRRSGGGWSCHWCRPDDRRRSCGRYRLDHWCRRWCRCEDPGRGRNRRGRDLARRGGGGVGGGAESCRVEPAQRLVERHDVP